MAMWCIYSRTSPSINAFEDEYLRDVVHELNPDAPLLSRYMLEKIIRDEYALFGIFLRDFIQDFREKYGGRPFAQCMTDGSTFANKLKYHAFGLQAMDPEFRENIRLCLAVLHLDGDKTADVVAAFEALCLELTGFHATDIFVHAITDRAETTFSRDTGIVDEDELEVCRFSLPSPLSC